MTDFLVILVSIMAASYLAAEAVKAGEPYKVGKIAVPLIKECEAELPRDLTCVLIAVPMERK